MEASRQPAGRAEELREDRAVDLRAVRKIKSDENTSKASLAPCLHGNTTQLDAAGTKVMNAGTGLKAVRHYAAAVCFALLICILLSACLSACGAGGGQRLNRYSAQYFDLFDTVTVFTAYASDEEEFNRFAEEMHEEMVIYHRLSDIYNDYEGINNIKTVNDNAGAAPVQVDERLIGLLEEAAGLCKLTDGAVNIAMGSVLSIWHDYREAALADPAQAKVPPMELLKEAAAHTDIADLKIDREASAVYLADPKMRLDAGAVAKGYATEMVCRQLQADGLTCFMLNVGGNVRTVGRKPSDPGGGFLRFGAADPGEPWSVGVQNPDTDSREAYLHTVGIADCSLVTSGTYQRYYEACGVRYHHIIHPDLLMPWDRYASVTILCEDSGLADGLSTAVFNMEIGDGLELIESLDGVEALWIYPDGTEERSSGFAAYEQ